MLSMLVIATTNQNKLKEFKEILKDLDIEVRSLADFGPIPEIIEDGETFDDNAYKKAWYTAKYLGLPAIADDSGLIVDALNGEPGVYSARYSGDNATDEENVTKLLSNLKGVENRKAHFQCVLSIAVPSGPALTYEGDCEGTIIDERKGDNGFGYDPLFYVPEHQCSSADLAPEIKNRISHRAKASAKLFEALKSRRFKPVLQEPPGSCCKETPNKRCNDLLHNYPPI